MAVASLEAKIVVAADPPSSPRISFSADFSNDSDFISICPVLGKEEKEKGQARGADFEFLSEKENSSQTMLTADELFFEGKLLPFWQTHHSEKLKRVNIKTKEGEEGKERVGEEDDDEEEESHEETNKEQENRASWFLDDDPSPRPPKCTVLWKELLRLKKHRARASSSLSPSSSSSSTSSCSSSLGDAARKEEREKEGKRAKKGLERTRSTSMRVRPMINVPICSYSKSAAALPPLFPLALKKGRVGRQT